VQFARDSVVLFDCEARSHRGHDKEGYAMDSTTINLLRSSFEAIAARKVDVAGIFYDRLFEVAPSVRPLFKSDMEEQRKKLIASLSTIVQYVDNGEKLTSYVSSMGQRHVGYGAKPEHYDVVGQVLLWTFEKVLGPDFTPEVRAAWTGAYTAVAGIMIDAATAHAVAS
jgi:hemoglobin-like flavoprotein